MATTKQEAPLHGDERRRASYKPGERVAKVDRLSTRAPGLIRDLLNEAANTLTNGYRSITQMLTIGMHRFLEDRPWDESLHGKHAFPWHGAKARVEGQVPYHIYLEPLQVNGRTVNGVALTNRAKKTATEEGVSGATFTLTFLWWMVTVVHPSSDPRIRAALGALPRAEPDKRFKGFLERE
jgi:hypothetical protein